MKKALTGITATGQLTIGNYIGAIKPLVNIQNEYEVFAFVADLHALTLPIGKEDLKKNTDDVLKIYKAAGVDTNKVKLFKQSDIQEHLVLNYYLLVNSTMGELSRMTQFKDKSQGIKSDNGTDTIPTGLFTYPVLQAADILLYNPDVVLVGEDQKQHLELARTLANRMNTKYGTKLIAPETFTPKVGFKIMSLTDPTKKMSKSDENVKGTIFLLDSDEAITKKIASAMTDSDNVVAYDVENKPGVSNLLTIYAALADITIEEALAIHKDMNYGDFKASITNKVIEVVSIIRTNFEKIASIDFLATDEVAKIAKETVLTVEKGIGIK